jgi:hypothetical protein
LAVKEKPSEKQTGPQTKEDEKPKLESYKSEEPNKRPKETSDTED